jgi:hypothetical protein
MGLSYKFKAAVASAVDLTSISVNADAAPVSTPRQGGFTLRNRVNFANVATANKTTFTMATQSSASSHQASLFYVLEVPNRTLVKRVNAFAVESQAIPAHTLTASTFSSAGASFLKSAILGINAVVWSKPSSGTRTAASHLDILSAATHGMTAGAYFGNVALQNASNSAAFEASQVEKVDASMTEPHFGAVQTQEAVASMQGPQGLYFPHGGYVTMALGPYNVATGSAGSSTDNSATATLAGVWEFIGDCLYVPE